MMEWFWEPSRYVFRCGAVNVGAIFRPLADGEKWRWRLWVNRRGWPEEGKASSDEAARAAVETRFADFLERAGLASKITGKIVP